MAGREYRVIIVGGGASGMAAAIAALTEQTERVASREKSAGRQEGGGVLLLESNDRVGKKILATGNGKCNFTNENIGMEHYHTDCPAVLKGVLTGFPTQAALEFFEGLGMLARKKNGCYYPITETAATVLNVLRLRLSELGCKIACNVRMERAVKAGDGFLVTYREGEAEREAYADSLILATGSKAGGFLQDKNEDPLRLARDLGLRSTPLCPALTKCVCLERRYYRHLAGVRAQVKLKLYTEKMDGENREFLREEAGELQLAKEGISGIAVFQFSGEIARKLAEGRRVFVEINFLPDFPEDQLEDWARKRLAMLPGRSLEEFFLGVLHKKVFDVCMQAERPENNMRYDMKIHRDNDVGASPNNNICNETILTVMRRAMHFATEVTGVADMAQAQVCRGGLALSQFDGKLECRTLPGLFACGEVLNVDGECGGYNLHFAWASGVLAGRAAMKRSLHLTDNLV